MKQSDLPHQMSSYFLDHLIKDKGLSDNTVLSRKEAFSQLFCYLEGSCGIKLTKLEIADMTAERISGFLDWLERERGCCIATRNLRLSAIKTFFAFIQPKLPEYMALCRSVLAIPAKSTPKTIVNYLTLVEIEALLGAIDTSSTQGFRDLVMLSVLYDSGARVQELIDLEYPDIRLGATPCIFLLGKGNKRRCVSIMDNTAVLLKRYIDMPGKETRNGGPLFCNRSHRKLTRAGVCHILQKHVQVAKEAHAGLFLDKVTPHVVRHSKAVHMLQAGVPLIYIRDFLGHVQITTTEVYARCDSTAVREAIAATNGITIDAEEPRWQRDSSLMGWLSSL